jgi:uncharacterized YigZ family protein
MHTLAGAASHQQEIRNSRFVAHAAPVADAQAAATFLDQARKPDATHNCWAWRVGQRYRFSDDGEPGGSAGRPILQAIDTQEMDQVAVLVVRWFGGIKLGVGGLARAYGGTAAECLRTAPRVALVATVRIEVSCDFGDAALIRARLDGFGASDVVPRFDADGARLAATLPAAQLELARATVRDATRGRGSVRLLAPESAA